MVHSEKGTELAAKLLGHRDGGLTLKHYIASSEEVNPVTALVLDKLIADTGTESAIIDEP